MGGRERLVRRTPGAVLLLALGAASPDALIARVALAQYRTEGVVDVRDLEGLSTGGSGPRPGSASSSRAPIASEAHPFTS
ncbi:hypothetical protein GCM10023205_49440 [Yinghuangia aomiensis]|uniref:Uncharacterized protein n=1 Tax=Yinghuangia aomiensis TaxID=676205 RepID=A0ABP9HQM0_9ACTN